MSSAILLSSRKALYRPLFRLSQRNLDIFLEKSRSRRKWTRPNRPDALRYTSPGNGIMDTAIVFRFSVWFLNELLFSGLFLSFFLFFFLHDEYSKKKYLILNLVLFTPIPIKKSSLYHFNFVLIAVLSFINSRLYCVPSMIRNFSQAASFSQEASYTTGMYLWHAPS